MESLTPIIEDRRCTWLGHVLRMTGNTFLKAALTWAPQGNRSKCRPKETWKRTPERILNNRWLSRARME